MRVITLMTLLFLLMLLGMEPDRVVLRGEDVVPTLATVVSPSVPISRGDGACMTALSVNAGSGSVAVMVPCAMMTSKSVDYTQRSYRTGE